MGLIFFGRVAQAVLALLALRVMTNMLSPEEVGRWSLLIAVTTFFAMGLLNPVGMFINRRLHTWVELGKIRCYMKYFAAYLSFVALLASLILFISSSFFSLIPDMSLTWLISLTFIAMNFATFNQVYIPYLNLLGYRGWFVVLTAITVAISLLVSMSFVYWFESTAEFWQLGQLTGQCVLAVVGGLIFFHFAKQHQEKESSAKEMHLTSSKFSRVFAFSWPLAIAVLLTWIQTQSYRFVAQDIIGLQALGLFVVGYGVSMSLIGVFESVISGYFMPIFYKRVASEDTHEQAVAWNEYASSMLVGLLLTISFIVAVSDELAFVLLDRSFAEASQFIIWGVLAEAARVIVGTYALLAHAGMKTKKLILPNVLAAVVSPVLVFVLALKFGADGVGASLFIAGGVTIISSHFLLSKSFELIMPWKALWKGLLIAVSFLIIAQLGHGILGMSDGFIESILWLLLEGMLLFGALFVMLKDQIKK